MSQFTAVIGNPNSSHFWRYSSHTGFDLTHSHDPTPQSLTLQTTTNPITIDPAKTALLVIDMQNFFLSPALGKTRGAGHAAAEQLERHAIPAARKAGIRVAWVNWGLTAKEVDDMPPGVKRAFGFEAVPAEEGIEGFGVDKLGQRRRTADGHFVRSDKGVGTSMGVVKDPNTGDEIDAGNVLMRDQWNTQLFPPLDQLYQQGKKMDNKPDVWIHKNRMSAMWGTGTMCEEFLEEQGITTLLFAGVNTDQCVGGTYQDCFSKGYDCILLGDGCGTTSPAYAQQCVEFNAANTFGFATSCGAFAEGVAKMA